MHRINGDENQELNDDGTPRRKYELDDEQQGRPFVKIVVGLVLANVFMLIKNVLPWGDAFHPVRSAQAAGEPGRVGQDGPEPVESGRASVFELVAQNEDEGAGTPENKPIDTSAADAYLTARPAGTFSGPEVISAPPRTALMAQPGNDNEALYGGAPGAAVALDVSEIQFNSLPAHSAGSGGSSVADWLDDFEDDDDDNSRPLNRLPVVTAPVVLGSMFSNQAVVIGLSDLLRNAYDPEGKQLAVSKPVSSSGSVVAREDGSWVFIPSYDDTTSVTFSYLVSDGTHSVKQLAFLDLLPRSVKTITGTDASETITGSTSVDVIDALAGDDTIKSLDGDDVIHGGAGNDFIEAGSGNDVVYAGAGDDIIFGGAGNDLIFGESGNDKIYGEEGDDRAHGGDGDDEISGGNGRDALFGDAGNDKLAGDAGDDVLDGGTGDDTLRGGADNDTLIGSAGSDDMFGETGNDVFIALAGDGDDSADGGEGVDTYDASRTTADATIDLVAGEACSDDIGTDTITNIENVVGGAGNDTITADDAANCLFGGGGDDTLTGSGGSDQMFGEGGNDVFIALAGDGDDRVDGGAGIDSYDASCTEADAFIDLDEGRAYSADLGDDKIVAVENAVGGSGNDIIVASNAVNVLSGGEGDDIFVFRSSIAIGMGKGSRDKILDFAVGDRIDLDDISDELEDAFEETFEDSNIRKFVLIGQQQEFARPGELRVKYDDSDSSHPITVLEGNIDNDSDAEFELEIAGFYDFRDEDFHWRA